VEAWRVSQTEEVVTVLLPALRMPTVLQVLRANSTAAAKAKTFVCNSANRPSPPLPRAPNLRSLPVPLLVVTQQALPSHVVVSDSVLTAILSRDKSVTVVTCKAEVWRAWLTEARALGCKCAPKTRTVLQALPVKRPAVVATKISVCNSVVLNFHKHLLAHNPPPLLHAALLASPSVAPLAHLHLAKLVLLLARSLRALALLHKLVATAVI
jgi:hypothetical protein